MGFMDELRKLTQPYDDEDDFFEGADEKFKPQPQATAQPVSHEQALFESSFAEETAVQAEPARKPIIKPPAKPAAQKAPVDGGIFGNLGAKKAPKKERTVNFGGKESQVILFSPKTFDEAGEIVTHIIQHRSVVMTLEGVPTDMARRLLDFISGIAYALQGKITPVSAKTYFVTPQNVDIVGGGRSEQPESDGQYF